MLLLSLIKLHLSFLIVLFIPGYFFMLALFGKKKHSISLIEQVVISFGLSITLSNFAIISLNFLRIKISATSIMITFGILVVLFLIIAKRRGNFLFKHKNISAISSSTLNKWSYRQIFLFLLLFSLSVGLRSMYLSRGIMPQTTDLGHHMYWSKYITTFNELPSYNMPDFIIGEHIIFAVISLLSGISFISPMPVLVLLLINIFSILAIFILTHYVAQHFVNKKIAKKIAVLSLLTIGIYYAISAPQAKFVSGGVIGNIIGNLLIPLSLYSLIVAIKNKSVAHAQLFFLFFCTLIYTHHLSTFVFLYIITGAFLLFLASLFWKNDLHFQAFFEDIKSTLFPFFHFSLFITLFLATLFVFFVHTPSYLNSSAINTAIGTPFKSTRTGLTIKNIVSNSGQWRVFFGLVGIFFVTTIVFLKKRKKQLDKNQIVVFSLMIAWVVMIFLMSWKPSVLKIDIPSNRIVSYISYPLAILSSIGFFVLLERQKQIFSKQIFSFLFLVFFGTGAIAVLSDLSDSARNKESKEEKKVNQTYLASQYLQKISNNEEGVLKDHIHLKADTWMKLFFMRGYRYPLSRSYLKRYNDPTKNRETCTRDMIAVPDSEIGNTCFAKTKVHYVVLNKNHDTMQFEKSNNFEKIYVSKDIVIFQKNFQ